jgi:hypothetical protein
MPGEEEGGIRRFYILFVALIEIGMVNINVLLLIELEMLIYAMSAGLFFYSFVYLRLQRTRKFKEGKSDPSAAPLLGGSKSPLMGNLDAESDRVDETNDVFNIGGGNVVAFMMAVCPVAFFAINTVLNLMGEGSSAAPFPYFKQTVFVSVILIGVIANVISNQLDRSNRASQVE